METGPVSDRAIPAPAPGALRSMFQYVPRYAPILANICQYIPIRTRLRSVWAPPLPSACAAAARKDTVRAPCRWEPGRQISRAAVGSRPSGCANGLPFPGINTYQVHTNTDTYVPIRTNTYQYVRYILVHANTASDRAVRGPLCARQHARCLIWVLGVGLLQLATAARGYRCMYEPRKTANRHFHGLKGRRRLSVRNGMYRGMYSHVLTTYTYHDTHQYIPIHTTYFVLSSFFFSTTNTQ